MNPVNLKVKKIDWIRLMIGTYLRAISYRMKRYNYDESEEIDESEVGERE